MNAIVAEQLLWSNEDDFETESLLSQSLTASKNIWSNAFRSYFRSAENSCEKRYSKYFYLRSLIMITKGQIQVCVRLKAEVG